VQLGRLLAVCVLALGAASAADGAQRLNRTLELLAQGQTVFGTFVFDMSVERAIEIADSGYDFAIIDLEHRPADLSALRTFLLGMTNKRRIMEKGSLQMDVTPVIRMSTSNVAQTELLAKQVLNLGAFGLMYPTVSRREQALHAVRVSRYPQAKNSADMEPFGLRGFEPFHPGMWYWGVGRREYYRLADVWPLDPAGEILLVVQIENREGVENIEDILTVPGIAAVLIGSFDLSTSLGVSGEVGDPAVQAAVARVVTACQARGIAVGATAGTVEDRLAQGQRFFNVSRDALSRARAAVGRNL